MRLAELRVGQVRGVHDHARARLDGRLDLDLPLIGHRRRAGRDRLEQRRGRRRGRQLLAVGAVRREAVAALGRAHDRAARAHDLRGGRHALDRLVEVLVEREAGVGRQHDVERARHRAHRGLPHDGAGRLVHREQLAAEGVRDALLTVQHDVEREVRARRGGDRAHVVVHRIAVRDPPARIRMADAGGVVERQRRLEAGEARRDELGAAGEAREEVRLDEAGRDADVGPRPFAVQPHRHIGAEAAHPRQRRPVARIVIDDPDRREHLVAEHRAQLLVGVAAVRSRGDEDDDVLEAHQPFELLEERRDDDRRAAAGACRRRC